MQCPKQSSAISLGLESIDVPEAGSSTDGEREARIRQTSLGATTQATAVSKIKTSRQS